MNYHRVELTMDDIRCRYFKPEWNALKTLCKTLYGLPYCGSGGPLHILLDDNNLRDEDITFCLEQCLESPEKPESVLGIHICYEYLKMSMRDRMLFDWYWCGSNLACCGDCRKCEYVEENE